MICIFCQQVVSVSEALVEKHHRLFSDSTEPEECFGSGNPVPFSGPALTDEDQQLLRSWAKGRDRTRDICDRFVDLANTPGFDRKVMAKLGDELLKTIPDECEHGRSTSGTCVVCSELDEKLAILFGTGEE